MILTGQAGGGDFGGGVKGGGGFVAPSFIGPPIDGPLYSAPTAVNNVEKTSPGPNSGWSQFFVNAATVALSAWYERKSDNRGKASGNVSGPAGVVYGGRTQSIEGSTNPFFPSSGGGLDSSLLLYVGVALAVVFFAFIALRKG